MVEEAPLPDDGVRGLGAWDGGEGGDRPGCELARGATGIREVLQRCN